MNLDFAKSDGLVAAVIQDQATGRVLMVGYINQEAFRRTVECELRPCLIDAH